MLGLVKEKKLNEAEERALYNFGKIQLIEYQMKSYKEGQNPITTLNKINQIIYPDRKIKNI